MRLINVGSVWLIQVVLLSCIVAFIVLVIIHC